MNTLPVTKSVPTATTCLMRVNLDMLRMVEVQSEAVEFMFGTIFHPLVVIRDHRPHVRDIAIRWLNAYEYAKESMFSLFDELKAAFGRTADVWVSQKIADEQIFVVNWASQIEPQGVLVIDTLIPGAEIQIGQPLMLEACYAHYSNSAARFKLVASLVTRDNPLAVVNARWLPSPTDDDARTLGLTF